MKNTIKSILLISIFLVQSCSLFQKSECEKAFTDEMNERCIKVIHEFAENPELVYSADTILHNIRYAISSESIIDVDKEQFSRIQRVFNLLYKNEYEIKESYFKSYEWQEKHFKCLIIYPITTKNYKLDVVFSFSRRTEQNKTSGISLISCSIND